MPETLAKQIREKSKLNGAFKLRSGAVSDTYFDKYLFESNPKLLRAICEEMAKQIPPDTEVLAGLEMGGIPIACVLSQITGIECAFIRKEAKTYGTCKYAEGPNLSGKRVVLIEDVVSSGGAIVDALGKLEADDVHPEAIICVIDRQTGGTERLAQYGYVLHSVFTMQDIEHA